MFIGWVEGASSSGGWSLHNHHQVGGGYIMFIGWVEGASSSGGWSLHNHHQVSGWYNHCEVGGGCIIIIR